MDGKYYYSNLFFRILMLKERYTLLDYFRMRLIEEISFFFFDVEDPVCNQNFEWKLKIKACQIRKEKLKST